MSNWPTYQKVESTSLHSDSVRNLNSLIEKTNAIIATLEAINKPISKRGRERINDTNTHIDQINGVKEGDSYNLTQAKVAIQAIQREIADFYSNLEKSAITGLLQNQDLIRLLTYKSSRDAALKNLEKQEDTIVDYITKLEDAVQTASRRIEQVTTGLIASKIQERVRQLTLRPKTKKYLGFWETIDQGIEHKYQESSYYWLKKRQFCLRDLFIFIVIVVIISILPLFRPDIFANLSQAQYVQIIALKVAIFTLLYARYYFAQKNYRIYASQAAKYNHMLVNAKMLNGYMEVEDRDPDLYSNLAGKVTDLITKDIESHHFKQDGDNDSPTSVVKNFIGKVGE